MIFFSYLEQNKKIHFQLFNTHTIFKCFKKKKLYIISLSKIHCLMLRRKKKKCFYLFRKNTGLFKGKNKKI